MAKNNGAFLCGGLCTAGCSGVAANHCAETADVSELAAFVFLSVWQWQPLHRLNPVWITLGKVAGGGVKTCGIDFLPFFVCVCVKVKVAARDQS